MQRVLRVHFIKIKLKLLQRYLQKKYILVSMLESFAKCESHSSLKTHINQPL